MLARRVKRVREWNFVLFWKLSVWNLASHVSSRHSSNSVIDHVCFPATVRGGVHWAGSLLGDAEIKSPTAVALARKAVQPARIVVTPPRHGCSHGRGADNSTDATINHIETRYTTSSSGDDCLVLLFNVQQDLSIAHPLRFHDRLEMRLTKAKL